jgi:hypothetical protein
MNGDVNPAEHSPISSNSNAPLRRAEHKEGSLTRLIEQQTAKIPSHFFLSASLSAMAVSAALELKRNARASRFVGSWVAPLLMMGIYNKLVKTFGTY